MNPDAGILSVLKIALHTCTHKSCIYMLNVGYISSQEPYLLFEVIWSGFRHSWCTSAYLLRTFHCSTNPHSHSLNVNCKWPEEHLQVGVDSLLQCWLESTWFTSCALFLPPVGSQSKIDWSSSEPSDFFSCGSSGFAPCGQQLWSSASWCCSAVQKEWIPP